MSEFLAMGGYAFYVWSSFGIALLLLGGIVAWSAHEARRVERETFARALRARAGRTAGDRAATGRDGPGAAS